MWPMTEADENNLRVLIAQMRDESPEEFVTLMMEVLIYRLEPNSIIGIRHKDEDDIPVAMIVVCKGLGPAMIAEKAMADIKVRIGEIQKNKQAPPSDDTGDKGKRPPPLRPQGE